MANLPLLPLEPSSPPPAPAPPAESEPATQDVRGRAAAVAAVTVARLKTAVAKVGSFVRHRRRVIIIGTAVAVVGGAGLFVVLQPVAPPPPPVVETAPAAVAAPPKPLQADAEGYYEPGYQFSVADRRFTRLTLRPDPSVRFVRTGTRQEFGCFDAVITPQTVRMTCELERVGTMTIDGRFVNRVATTAMDAPTISALLTVRNTRGEVLYSARDNFVWRPAEQ